MGKENNDIGLTNLEVNNQRKTNRMEVSCEVFKNPDRQKAYIE